MKLIVYRGGVVSFQIPADWREEYSDTEGGMFYGDRPDSGTLRLTVITIKSPKELHPGAAKDLFEVVLRGQQELSFKSSPRDRMDGNAVLKYQEAARERGKSLIIFYWVIANPLPPHHARIITFSYTILAEQQDLKSVQRDLEMLESEIELAMFSPEIGVVPE